MPANTGWTGETADNDRMAAQAPSDTAASPRTRGNWEFLWRFLAVAMLIELVWAVWIAIQINPPPIALPAAFEAAAKARATRNVEGQIRPADVIPSATAAPAAASAPPVNVDRLKFSDSIETAIPEQTPDSAKLRAQ